MGGVYAVSLQILLQVHILRTCTIGYTLLNIYVVMPVRGSGRQDRQYVSTSEAQKFCVNLHGRKVPNKMSDTKVM